MLLNFMQLKVLSFQKMFIFVIDEISLLQAPMEFVLFHLFVGQVTRNPLEDSRYQETNKCAT